MNGPKTTPPLRHHVSYEYTPHTIAEYTFSIGELFDLILGHLENNIETHDTPYEACKKYNRCLCEKLFTMTILMQTCKALRSFCILYGNEGKPYIYPRKNMVLFSASKEYKNILEYIGKVIKWPLYFDEDVTICIPLKNDEKYSLKIGELPTEGFACAEAAKHGSLECLQYLREIGYRWDIRTCIHAAMRGHVECLKYARDNGCAWDYRVISAAIMAGKLNCVEYCLTIGMVRMSDLGYPVYSRFPLSGNIDCVKFIVNNFMEELKQYDHSIITAASLLDDIECLEYLYSVFPARYADMRPAIRAGKYHSIRFLHEHGMDWDEEDLHQAAEHGHLECIKYICEDEEDRDPAVIEIAVMGGHIECVKYLYEKGFRWFENGEVFNLREYYDGDDNESKWLNEPRLSRIWECWKYALATGAEGDVLCSEAAAIGRLDILQHAHESGFPWDECTCIEAAENGKFDCLVYAIQNGCPWSTKTINAAHKGGNINCINYFRQMFSYIY